MEITIRFDIAFILRKLPIERSMFTCLFSFWQSMFMDTKLNPMQHSIVTLQKLCKRYHMYGDKNPLIVAKS